LAILLLMKKSRSERKKERSTVVPTNKVAANADATKAISSLKEADGRSLAGPPEKPASKPLNQRSFFIILLAIIAAGALVSPIYNTFFAHANCQLTNQLLLFKNITDSATNKKVPAIIFSGTISNDGDKTLLIAGINAYIIDKKTHTPIKLRVAVFPTGDNFGNWFDSLASAQFNIKNPAEKDLSNLEKLASFDAFSGNLLILSSINTDDILKNEDNYMLRIEIVNLKNKHYPFDFNITKPNFDNQPFTLPPFNLDVKDNKGL